jgi:hypothetical protein
MSCIIEEIGDLTNRVTALEAEIGAPDLGIGNFYLTLAEGLAATETGEHFGYLTAGGQFVYATRTAGGHTVLGTFALQSDVDLLKDKLLGLPITAVTIADLTANNAPIINAAIALSTNVEIVLPKGVIQVNEPILGASYKTLRGAGAGLTVLKAKNTFTFDATNNAIIFANNCDGFNVKDLTVDASKVYGFNIVSGLTDLRLNGIRHTNCRDYLVREVRAYNATGYSFWPVGTANNDTQLSLMTQRGTYENCWSYNANVHFEPLRCNDMLFDNCHGRAGDGDISCEAGFHPYVFGKRIRFTNCTFESGGAAILAVPSGGFLLQASFENCDFTSTNVPALRGDSQGNPMDISIVNCRLKSLADHGSDLGGGGGGFSFYAANSKFSGSGAGISVAGILAGGEIEMNFVNCLCHGHCTNPVGQSNGMIITNATKRVRFDGELRATAANGAIPVANGAANFIVMSRTTLLTPDPLKNMAVKYEDTDQIVAVADGGDSRLDITLKNPVLDKTKAFMSIVQMDGAGQPGSYRVELTNGSPFATVRIAGNHAGKTFSYYYREMFD